MATEPGSDAWWKDKRLSEMTRDELIAALLEMHEAHKEVVQAHKDERDRYWLRPGGEA